MFNKSAHFNLQYKEVLIVTLFVPKGKFVFQCSESLIKNTNMMVDFISFITHVAAERL